MNPLSLASPVVKSLAGLLLGSLSIVQTIAQESQTIEFNRDIRPILSENCFYCHGPDPENRQADLRLDNRQAALDASAIVPGTPAESLLAHRIDSDDPDLVMPPRDSNKKLSQEQKELIKKWIQQGAQYQTHWAYQPPTRSPNSANSIDALVAKQLQQHGLEQTHRADPRTLLRRVYYDLIGLPPSPDQVAAFEADPSEKAYNTLIESLLENPHFGERMAIGWLDVVRFADTIGYHSDNPRNVWPYRDYVIASFNANKPFDRFTIEQIAGDLLPDANQETLIGSAFNRLILSTEEGGAQPKDYEARMVADRVRAIGTVWLGQTTACAQCHDHKYDPITMKDFYSLGAFFADIQEPIVGAREEGLAITTPNDSQRLANLDAAIEQAIKDLEALQQLESQPNNEPIAGIQQQIAQAKERVETARKQRDSFYKSLPKCLVTKSTPNKRTVRLLPRGNWMDQSGPLMKPALPEYLTESLGQSTERELNRLDLARWLVSRENPLTARVTMDRLWKHFFGTGLSKVLDDLGTQGELPVNQELLDFLACEFMDSGWDFKHMIRTIVESHTYQLSSQADEQVVAADPLNRWTARQSPFRMEAELIRDYALHHAGLLANDIGGRSAKPYQPAGYWDSLNFPTRTYAADKDRQQYRRGIYTWWQRTFLHPSLLAFDAPSREECCAQRSYSNTPQQALVLLNDPTYVEAARGLAYRAIQSSAPTQENKIDWIFLQVLQRSAKPLEKQELMNLLEKHIGHYKQHPQEAAKLQQIGIFQPSETIDPIEFSAWTLVARVLLNLHETITRD